MNRKITLLLILLSVFFISPQNAFAEQSFKDLPSTHWASEEILILVEKDVIGGYSDNTVRPNNPVTREELAKIAFSLFPAAMDEPLFEKASQPDYPDLYQRWSTPFLKTAARLVPGYTDGRFKPADPATRWDVATLLLYAKLIEEGYYQFNNDELDIFVPVPNSETWAQLRTFKEYSNLEENYLNSSRYLEVDPQNKNFFQYAGQYYSQLNNIAFLIEQNIIKGYSDNTLRMDKIVTRAETCALARRMADLNLTGTEKFLVQPPVLNTLPHTIELDKSNAHSVLVDLGQWYKNKYPDTLDRAKAIYDFLMFNFTYNWDYRAGITDSAPTDLYSTITTGTGTYINFSNLYAYLAKYAGLEVSLVSGNARNPTDFGPHAWIELKINDSIVPVDPTYGICTGNDYFNNFDVWETKGYKWEEQGRKNI